MLKAVATSIAIVLVLTPVVGAAGPELKTDEQKTLYALGLVIARNLASFNLTKADLEVVEAGIADGTQFDSSVKRGEPLTIGLAGGIIKCWSEGVPLMKVGGKSRFVCPSDLAYGDQGRPPVIKPGATLVFEIELLEIVK